jgi:hypothetical protein
MKKILILTSFILIMGCSEDFLDINHDPNSPSVAPLGQLLTSAENSLSDAITLGWKNYPGFTEFLSIYMQQLSSREEMDQYSLTGQSLYIVYQWQSMYSDALKDLNSIIEQGTESKDLVYTGISKILTAYGYSLMVDAYGDIPFSEALRADENILYPVWDDDEDIYPQLLDMIDEGIADIENTEADNNNIPGDDDIIYAGDTDLWIKAANTIKLKMYNQLRLYKDVRADVNALLTEGNLISSTNENMAFYYGASSNPDTRHPGYGEYEVGQKGYYINPWFWELLRGYNVNRFHGITDPRIPYYFYKQLAPGQPTREGNPTEYRDGGFVSIYFGSTGVNRDHSTDGSMTTLGIYPIGGRYDTGDAIAVDGTSGTGAVPHRFLTYADRLFIEAELMNAGLVTGDTSEVLSNAIKESFKQVDWVVSKSKTKQTVPTLNGKPAVTTYVNAVMAEYAAEDVSGQLEIIMTEKWISSFGTSIDQYTDYRRTGYPVLWDPNNSAMAPGGYVTPPEGPAVPVQSVRAFMISLPWSNDDIIQNRNAPEQKDPYTDKVFWDVN